MATILRAPHCPHLTRLTTTLPSRATPPRSHHAPPTRIHCGSGPRSNRGPLLKGRILSKEAILAIQSLKRAHTKSSSPTDVHVSLSRLLKSDLLATLRELLRQDQCAIALQVFSAVRTEPWYNTDFTLYADLVLALSRNDMWRDIDRLIEGLEMEGQDEGGVIKLDDKKWLGRLIRGLIGLERRESLVRVYRVMKRFGWGCFGSGVDVDEYLAKVLSEGFVRFGDVELAKELDLALESYLNACLGNRWVLCRC